MAILLKAEQHSFQTFDVPSFTKADFPLNTSVNYKYSIWSTHNVVYDQNTHIVESFVVNWILSWNHNDYTIERKQLKQAFWTNVKTDTESADICQLKICILCSPC